MPIEFKCSECEETLSVPEEVAGKKARCPSCSAIQNVPTSSPSSQATSNPFGSQSPSDAFGSANAPAPVNPYATPNAVETPSQPLAADGEILPQPFDATQAVSVAWNLLQKNLGLMVGATVVSMVINIGLNLVGNGIQAAIGDPQSGAAIAAAILFGLLSNFVQIFVAIGMYRISFAVARNQPAEIGMLFSGGPWFFTYLIVSILFGIAMGLGFLLLIIPGIYVALTYWPSFLLVIDRNTGVGESFSTAGQLASGNRLNSLAMGVICCGIFIVGLLACFVGLLLAVPLVNLIIVVSYLMMTGQNYVGRA